MSVLVLVGGDDVDEPIVRRLLRQGDDVRVLEATAGRRELWRSLGAHLAVGDAADPDLVERAAQNVRTIVVITPQVTPEILQAVVTAAPLAGVDRLVACAPSFEGSASEVVRASALSFVLIASGRPGLLRRRAAAPGRIAAAVDAADDLGGDPRLEVDLTTGRGVADLGLAP